jgi:hypothetical protein
MLMVPLERFADRALAGHQHDAGLDLVAHLQHQADLAAVVEQAHRAPSSRPRLAASAGCRMQNGLPSRSRRKLTPENAVCAWK